MRAHRRTAVINRSEPLYYPCIAEIRTGQRQPGSIHSFIQCAEPESGPATLSQKRGHYSVYCTQFRGCCCDKSARQQVQQQAAGRSPCWEMPHADGTQQAKKCRQHVPCTLGPPPGCQLLHSYS